MQARGPWKVHTSEKVYENPWVRVYHEDVTTPGGTPGIYGRVHFKNRALGVVAINSKGEIPLIGQHRYPLDQYTWEIPEGGGPSTEDPLVAIQRELLEEAGVVAQSWQPLAKNLQVSNSVTDELADLFLAWDLEITESSPEECELLELQWVPFSTALDWVAEGKICDLISVTALLLAKQNFPEALKKVLF